VVTSRGDPTEQRRALTARTAWQNTKSRAICSHFSCKALLEADAALASRAPLGVPAARLRQERFGERLDHLLRWEAKENDRQGRSRRCCRPARFGDGVR
jgi:hypothetical protein